MSNEQNPATMRRQRAIKGSKIKGSCTRTNTYVDSIVSVNPTVTAQLEERRAKLEQYWSEYNAVQSQLEVIDENEANDRVQFEEAFYALCAKIREILNPPRLSSRSSAAPSPSMHSTYDATESIAHVRLPKLNLPTFSGKYDEWFPFFDAFNSIIHSNVSLSSVQKLQYLRASLVGEASDVIGSLEISDVNYTVAWNLLNERYDNKRVIVHTHIKAIMELPSITKENCGELWKIADGASRHIQALQALKRPTIYWDDLLVHILSSKLDTLTLREWQSSLTGSDLPTLKQFTEFIAHRCQVLEATDRSRVAVARTTNTRSQANTKHQSTHTAIVKFKCSYCRGEHSIYHCKEFLSLPVSRRNAAISDRKICFNCLRSTDHAANKCGSGRCKICKVKHNTLLHATNNSEAHNRGTSAPEEPSSGTSPITVTTHAMNSFDKGYVMLSTAIVHVFDAHNSRKPCRVLLDCGSQANFVSRKFLDALGLKPRSLNITISGINGTASRSTQTVRLKLQSRLNSYSAYLECIVTEQVTAKLPSLSLKRDNFDIPRNLELADPRFHESMEIDVLIGAELFWELLCVGQVKSSPRHPTLQKTRLGWVLAGRLGDSPKPARKLHSLHATITNGELHEQLTRFWQQEDIIRDETARYTLDETRCEQHFLKNVSQTKEGKYIVGLPVKEGVIDSLGNSRDVALKRLHNLEKRFKRDTTLKEPYVRFMNEYLSLGHMKIVNVRSNEEAAAVYLPHHCVNKVSDQSSRFRVVFDASCRSSTGLSLNDALMVGPVIQQDLASILMRFRTFRYAFSADIVKMYRQILVDPSQTRLQRILWRGDTESEVETYELMTVTYGTSPASYLATRCLKHLAERHASEYPIGSERIKRDFYMDDLLTGADTIDDAKIVRDQIIELLRLGTFELSKWAFNCPELLKNVESPRNELVSISDRTNSRVLGVKWNRSDDTLCTSYETRETCDVITKRTILSEVARLFDPLGLLGPIVVIAKLILQELWQSGSHWDETVPQSVHSRWVRLKLQLSNIDRLRIPRCIKLSTDLRLVQIHGFCDASQHAYGACVYIRTRLNTSEYHTELLCSKSRVAPVKAVCIPRLELSAALLLARLMDKVDTSFDISQIRIFLWSDSTIALNWITSPSRKWTVFVANRVGEIQRLTELKDWRHVSSNDNPADVLSRGLDPYELKISDLWWHGPTFLQYDEEQWPDSNFIRSDNDLPEKRVTSSAVTV